MEKLEIFLVTIISSLIVHFQLYSSMITGADTLINNMYHQADVWEVMLLRFGLNFVQILKGNIVSPVLSTFISSILLGITTLLIIDIFKIKNKYFKFLIAIIFVVAPNISATLTFFYCSDAYMLGMLFATLAIFLIRKYENKNWIILLSSMFVALSISMYQTYISVSLVLIVAILIIDILNKKDIKKIFIDIFKYAIMIILGFLLFYIISHLILLITGLQVSNYSGASTIGLHTLLEFPKLLPQAYESFFNYFFNDKIIPNAIWGTNILYTIIFSVILFSTIGIIIENKIYKNILNFTLLIILIVLCPICFGIIEIIVPDVDIHILMACSMIYIFPIFFKILEMLPKLKLYDIFNLIVFVCTLAISWIYTWQDNASYIAMNSMQNQAISTAERVLVQIEQLDEYTPDTPILFLGGLESNPYLQRDNTSIEAKKLYDRTWGFISSKSTIWWGNLDSWRKIFYEYEGVNLNLVSEWESADIFETEEYKSMKLYPEKGSIKVINGTVVVKLSN